METVLVVFERHGEHLLPKRLYHEGMTLVLEGEEVRRCTIGERVAEPEGYPDRTESDVEPA